MAEDFAIGKELEIPKSVLDNIKKIDKKINDISKDSELMAQHFGSAMIRMGNGAETLLKKLQQVHQIVGGLNNLNIKGLSDISNGMNKTATDSEKMANSLSKAAVAINKSKKVDEVFNPQNSVLAWQGLQKNIAQIQERQEKLTTITKEYESTLKSIKSGKGGVLTKDMQDSYKAAQKELEANKQIIESYKQKQQAIIAYQQEQKKQAQNAEALRSIATGGSLNEQRQIDAMKRMNDYYRELERTSASAEKKRQEEAKKSAREVEKATQKEQREREKSAKSAERQQKAEERLRKSQEQRTNNNAINAYNRAMASSEALITQRINKIAKLRQAEEMLTKASGNYSTQISKIRSEIERLNKLNQGQVDSYGRIIKSHQGLINTSGQLMRKLALIFSVSQIQGYLLQIRDVTGEFEKQNTALASILQNKDKADKLFGQITELAVKSPFTLKELITYTKSLSAYQVEYEKLYDTTKMLADVSAGLGVDMQRLILAFGQVKASNFLRGTEVRQFTEAGLNILGELAKYYSELEGRMISVGEVQERVTKRMVAFGDVEEIFKRVTSAGGVFYNMQEKQSETIAGLVSNLRDSIDLMLNDIGSANSGAIKQLILTVRSLYENWREVAWYIKKAVVALGAWKTASLLASLGNSNLVKSIFSVKDLAPEAAKGLTLLQKAMMGLKPVSRGLIAGGALLLIAWLGEFIRQSTQASRKAEQLSEALKKVQAESSIRASELSSNFEKLADEAVNAADGSEEQNRALKELNLTYSELVPSEMLKIENLRQMKGEYDSVTSAIYSKIEAQTKEKMIQQVSNVYGSDAVSAADSLSQKLTEYGISLSKAKTIVAEFRKEFDKGLVSSPQTAQKVLEDLIKSFTGLSVSLTEKGFKQAAGGKTWGDVIISELDNTYNAFVKFRVETEKVKNDTLEIFREGGGTELYSKLKAELNDISKYQEDWNKKNKGNFEFSIEFSEESKKRQIAQYQKFIDDINKKISSGEIKQTDIVSANLIIEDAQKAIDKLNVSDSVQKIEQLRLEFSKLYDIDFGKLNFTQMLETQGFFDYIKVLDENINNYKKIVSVFEEAAKRGEQVPLMQADNLLNGKTLDEVKRSLEALKSFRDSIYKDFEKQDKKGGTENAALKRLKDQIALIKKAGDEYKKLRKYYGETDATAQIRESFADAFDNLGLDVSMSFDTEGIADGIRNLQYETIKGGKEVVDKTLAELESSKQIEVKAKGLEEIQRQIDDIFSNYEFNLELQSAGIDTGAFKDMLQDLGATDQEISMIGLDATTFEEAAEKIRNIISDLQKGGGEAQLEQARKFQEQLTALEVKEARKRFDELAKLREKYQTNQEKMQTVQTSLFADKDALALLEEQKAMGNEVNEEQEELLKLRIQAGEDALLQLRSEALQLTDFWQKLFSDLNDISVSSLLDLSRITDDIIANRSEIKGDKGELKGYSSSYTDKNGMKKEVTLTKQQYQQLLKQNNQVADEIQKKNPFRVLYEAMLKGKKEGETQLDYYKRLESILGDVSNAASGAAEDLMDIFNANDEAKEMLNNIIGIADGAINLGLGVAKISSGDFIGGGLSAINGIASIVTSIRKIHDNKREREIKRQIDLIEDLQRSYEKLQEAIEGAYSIDTLKKSTDQAIANLKAQNEALEAARAAEIDKKKTDDARVKEFESQIADNLDRIAELEQDKISKVTAGILDDGLSAADAFVDAWLEAFQETGDGLKGLEDNFNEMLLNLVKRQTAMTLVAPLIENMQKELEKYINKDDTELTISEADRFAKYIKEQLPELSESLENMFESLKDVGLDFSQSGDTMSGLSKSISGITEETADALAAITESIRYFSADSNAVLKQIYNAIAMPNVENPFLMELRQQTSLLTSINSLFSSVIKTSAGKGKVIRMEIA